MSDTITIVDADLTNPNHAAALLDLLDAYMRDPMEGGTPAPEYVRQNLIPGLLAHPASYSYLAYQGEKPVGFAVCFLSFSTFNARPLINIHDIYVDTSLRGLGIGRRILDRIEATARSMNGCALTLEVRKDNHRARGLYRKFGFAHAEIGATQVEFWRKPLD